MDNKIKIINCTPHPLVIFDNGEKVEEIIPSGIIPRLNEKKEEFGIINNIPIFKKKYGEINNLPEPKERTLFYVSSLIANSSDRKDLIFPNELVRDEKGRIIGISSFATKDGILFKENEQDVTSLLQVIVDWEDEDSRLVGKYFICQECGEKITINDDSDIGFAMSHIPVCMFCEESICNNPQNI